MRLYALFYLGSFFLFVVLSTLLLKARGVNGKLRNTLALVYVLGMMLGAHAFHYAFCEHTLVNEPIRAFYASLPNDEGGLLANLSGLRAATVGAGGLWGGPLFAVLTMVPLVVFLKLSVRTKHDLLDAFAVGFPYALALAKVGCLVNGCCYGVEGSGPLYVRFTWVPEDSGCYMRSCFPTQLLDLLIYLSIATALLAAFARAVARGRLVLWFVLLFSVARFASEFTRGDNVGGKLLGLSPVQVVLLVSFAISGALLIHGQLYGAVLNWRASRMGVQTRGAGAAAAGDRGVAILDRYALVFLVVLLLALFVFPVLALPLSLLGILFLIRLYLALSRGGSAVQWSRAFNAFACSALVLLFVSAFLLASFVPFYIGVCLFLAALVAILDRFYASTATVG